MNTLSLSLNEAAPQSFSSLIIDDAEQTAFLNLNTVGRRSFDAEGGCIVPDKRCKRNWFLLDGDKLCRRGSIDDWNLLQVNLAGHFPVVGEFTRVALKGRR